MLCYNYLLLKTSLCMYRSDRCTKITKDVVTLVSFLWNRFYYPFVQILNIYFVWHIIDHRQIKLTCSSTSKVDWRKEILWGKPAENNFNTLHVSYCCANWMSKSYLLSVFVKNTTTCYIIIHNTRLMGMKVLSGIQSTFLMSNKSNHYLSR